MGGGASSAGPVREALDFIGAVTQPKVVQRKRLAVGNFVAIDVEETGRKNQAGIYDEDVTLQIGVVKGMCAVPGHNAVEYTIQVEEGCTMCIRRRWCAPLSMPELKERGIEVTMWDRDVAIQVEWQGGAKFVAVLLKREKGLYDVRFKGGKREILTGLHISQLSPVDEYSRIEDSPETLAPDPLWLLDRKIQANIDVKWPIARRMKEAYDLLRGQMRPPGAPPVRGPFVGTRTFDSEGYPAHPAPLEELKVDGAFVDRWGKYAGKIKFASTYKIGPNYPKNDAWIDRVDAGDSLYFHAALPVYAGLICLGMFKLPGESGQGQPEWVRASDVALVGVALYVNGELFPGPFEDPPLEKQGLQKYGHESCHFIPGCTATYMADGAWIGASFCLAPTDIDYELLDDIYSIASYHHLLREWARRPRAAGESATEPREIDVQVNLVLSTSYLANLRQVCAGSVKVVLSDQGLAMAYERMQHIQDHRLHSAQAKQPKRPRKALSELSVEEGLERRLPAIGDGGHGSGYAIGRPPVWGGNAMQVHQTSSDDATDEDSVPPPPTPPETEPQQEDGALASMRGQLEQRVAESMPPPPTKGKKVQPPSGPPATTGSFAVKGTFTPGSTFQAADGSGGSAANPIRGPEFAFRRLVEGDDDDERSSSAPTPTVSGLRPSPAGHGAGGFGGRKPQPPPRPPA